MTINDSIAIACLEALQELEVSDEAAGDSKIKALMLSAKKQWQQEAIFLAMRKIREKVSSVSVPPSTELMAKPVGAVIAETR
jgi:hypothetical protein